MRLPLALVLGLAACTFDPRGAAMAPEVDAGAPGSVGLPEAAEPADAAPAPADAAPVDAAPAAPDADDDDDDDERACGEIGQPCCDEAPVCRGLSICLGGTCIL